MTGCDRSKGGSQSKCGSMIVDQNSSHSTRERCLLVALVQTIYTTYGNDSIHFGVGTAMAASAGSIGYPGGGGRRSGNSCTISSRHSDDGCTSSGRRDGNGDSANSSGRSATAAAGAPVAGGGARSLHGPCYHIFILSFAVNLHLYLLLASMY